MKRQILAAIEGYFDEPPFVIIVREGDEAGQRLEQGDEGFIEAIREIAKAPHAVLSRAFLAQYDQLARKEETR